MDVITPKDCSVSVKKAIQQLKSAIKFDKNRTFAGLTLSGKVTSGSFASPVDVTNTREYGVELHYSGNNYNVTGLRSRARLKTTDTSATAQGALLQAANEDGINAGVLNGALIEAIGKSDANAATITTMRGCLINTEWGNYDTVTNLKTLHVRTHSRNAAGAGSFGTGYGIYIENEAVGGNGQAWDAGIYFKGTNLSAGNYAFVDGIDMTGATISGVDIKLSDGSVINDANGRWGVGTLNPSSKLHVLETTEQLRLGYSASVYSTFRLNSAGDLVITATGKDIILSGVDLGIGVTPMRALHTRAVSNAFRMDRGDNNVPFIILASFPPEYGTANQVWGFGGGNTSNFQITDMGITPSGWGSPKLVVLPTSGNVGISEIDPETLLELTHAQPWTTWHCSTHSNDDGSGASKHIFKREDGNTTETTCFQFEASHDGAGVNDQLGKGVWSVNTGTGLVEGLRLDSLLRLGIATTPTARLHLPAGVATAGLAPLKLTAGTDLTSPEAGVIEYDGTHFSVTEVVDRRVLSVASDSITTAQTVADTVSEITVFTAPISAEELHAGKVLRIWGSGQASTHDANDTLTIRIKIGGTLLTSLGVKPGQAADDSLHFWNVVTIRTTGANGTIASHGHIMIKDTEVHENDQDVVVNTTGANDMTVTFQWGAADAGNTATLDQCFLEVLV